MVNSYWVGNCEYSKALEIQKFYYDDVYNNPQKINFIGVEHPTVITLGKRIKLKNVLHLKELGYPIYETDRGGLVTAHNPGQLVIYPIVKLSNFGGLRNFIKFFNPIVNEWSESIFNESLKFDNCNPGYYNSSGLKVGSLGLNISRGITKHGLALNIYNNLEIFNKFSPCGSSINNLTNLSDKPVNLADIFYTHTKAFEGYINKSK